MSGPAAEPDYYVDAAGLLVFTRSYLLRRGHCCGHGCRHCPWRSAAGGESLLQQVCQRGEGAPSQRKEKTRV